MIAQDWQIKSAVEKLKWAIQSCDAHLPEPNTSIWIFHCRYSPIGIHIDERRFLGVVEFDDFMIVG